MFPQVIIISNSTNIVIIEISNYISSIQPKIKFSPLTLQNILIMMK